MKTLNKKNPLVAGVLSLIFGPLGYIYLGFNFFVAGIAISLIIGIVLAILNFPYPGFFNYLQLIVWAYFGYKFAHISNLFADEQNLSETDIKEVKSMSFAFYLMIHVMMSIVKFYAIVVAIFFIIVFFSKGEILLAFLTLFFGIGLAQWIIGSIFSIISVGIMKVFKIDKKYL
jgi:hypothetical protein